MTVAQLIKALKKLPPNAPVSVWLPGTHLGLSGRVFAHEGDVLLEGGEVFSGDLDYGNMPRWLESASRRQW